MPCSDSRDHADQEALAEVLQITTRLACAFCVELEARGQPIPGWANDWWLSHRLADAQRIAAEKDRIGMNALGRVAKHFTPAERRALLWLIGKEPAGGKS